jgi:anti-anti-sigma factor
MDYETPDLAVRDVDGVTIARLRHANLTGAVDIQRITTELEQIIQRGTRKLVIDFKYVRYAGSAALGMLIMIQKRMAALGGTVVLSHSEHIAELLTVSRTASLFKLAPDPRAAFKLVQ